MIMIVITFILWYIASMMFQKLFDGMRSVKKTEEANYEAGYEEGLREKAYQAGYSAAGAPKKIEEPSLSEQHVDADGNPVDGFENVLYIFPVDLGPL